MAFLLALLFVFVLGDVKTARVFYFISILSGIFFVLSDAIKGLFKQRFFNIEFLMVVAVLGAVYINQLAEASAVVFFFSLAEIFEEFGVERSRRAVDYLLKQSPKTAVLAKGNTVPVEHVRVGEIIVVRPGEIIPLDGKVVKGSSSVDESTITGESFPKNKNIGSSVFAGAINQNGYLEIKTTRISKNSVFSKIVKLVKEAQDSRAPAQEFIDKFARYYTPAVVAGAVFVSVVPVLFFGGLFSDWFYKGLVFLVISCPCALVISTPVSIASAIGGASRAGVLIKGGRYLEALAKVKIVAFDKTRTLTLGKLSVSDILAFDGFTKEEVLADAAGIEKFSSHPLAKSILKFAREQGVAPHTMKEYKNVAGKGGRAVCIVCDDLEHCVGNMKFVQTGQDNVSVKKILKRTERFEKEGKTVVFVKEEGRIIGALAFVDKMRSEARLAIEKLTRLGIESAVLTGDNRHAANFVARRLGIRKVYSSLLPSEKTKKIEELKRKFGFVAMVGDGVNDAPSLASSSVGIAMAAGGSDVAVETADVALMNSDLLNVPHAISLGKETLKTIRQNIIAALGVKAIFLALAVFGFAHLEYAVGADSAIAVLAVLNSLKLFNQTM